jgi:uncharacterized protein (DUF2062 family)
MIRRKLQRWLPDEDTLRKHPSLRWLGPLLRRPWLWHLGRRQVATGAAIGVFFGFLIPVMQIAAAAVVAIALRANLPVAAAATLVSNPVTYVPIWVAAHQTGAFLLGKPVDQTQALGQAEALAAQVHVAAKTPPKGWGAWILGVGKPLALGLLVFAVTGATITWLLVHFLWIRAVRLKWRRRHAPRALTPAAARLDSDASSPP